MIGKFGMIERGDGYWNIGITGIHKNKELSTRRVNNLARAISASVGIEINKLSGEALGRVRDNEGAFLCAILLGVRRKRKDSVKVLSILRKSQFK